MGQKESHEARCFYREWHIEGSSVCVWMKLKRKLEETRKRHLSSSKEGENSRAPLEKLPVRILEKISSFLSPNDKTNLAACNSLLCSRLIDPGKIHSNPTKEWSLKAQEYFLLNNNNNYKGRDSTSPRLRANSSSFFPCISPQHLPPRLCCCCYNPRAEEISGPKYSLYLLGTKSPLSQRYEEDSFWRFDIPCGNWEQLADCPIRINERKNSSLVFHDEQGSLVVGQGYLQPPNDLTFFKYDAFRDQWDIWEVPTPPIERQVLQHLKIGDRMNKAGHYRSYCNCGTLLFSWTPEMNTMYSTLADSEMSTPEELRVNRFYCLDMKKLDREWKECAMFPFEGFLLRVEVVPDEMNGLLYVSGQFGTGLLHAPSKFRNYYYQSHFCVSYVYDIEKGEWRLHKSPEPIHLSSNSSPCLFVFKQKEQEENGKEKEEEWIRRKGATLYENGTSEGNKWRPRASSFQKFYDERKEECFSLPKPKDCSSEQEMTVYDDKVFARQAGVFCYYDLKKTKNPKWKKIVTPFQPNANVIVRVGLSKSFLAWVEQKKRERNQVQLIDELTNGSSKYY